MTSSNNYTEKNSLYGITEETFDEAHLKVDDIKWLDEEDENLSVDDIKWKEVDEEKRQVKGNDTASKGSFISVSDAIAYGSNGKNGKKGNGGRSGEKPPEHTDPDYFPVDIFPDWIREFIEEHKRIKGFPEQYTAAGVLAALSLACGNNRYIEEPFISKAALWIALVGRPGANKTHPLNAALAPFKEIDEKLFNEYEPKKRAYDKAPEKSKPDEPTLKQLTVNDTTMEALTRVLQNNPDGVLLHKDELAGWVKEMDRYRNGGGDMQNWNSIFSLQQIRVNRASGKNLFVSDPYVSIAGTIQPSILKNLNSDGEMIANGFLDRMLFVFPEVEKKVWKIKQQSALSAKLYKENILKIHSDRPEKKRFDISDDSVALLEQWHEEILSRVEGARETEEGIVGKLQTYAMRLILLLHIAQYPEDAPTIISAQTTQKAIQLLKYFENQATKVRSIMTGKKFMGNYNEKQRSFYAALPQSFTTSQAQAVGKTHSIPERSVRDLLKKLKQENIIKQMQRGSYQKN